MKEMIPSTGLETILNIMKRDSETFSDNIFETIHFKTSQLHGISSSMRDRTITIGREEKERKLQLKIPFITSKKLFEKIPNNAKLGIALGQAVAGMPITIYQGMPKEIDDLLKSYRSKTIFSLGPARSNMKLEALKKSDMVFIEQMNWSSDPPIFSPEIRKGKDILKLVSLVNEIVDVPVIYDIESKDVTRDIDFVLVSNVDALMVSSPTMDIENRTDITMVTSIIVSKRQMEIFKSTEKGTRIIINGPFRGSNDILKTMALGADIIGLDDISLSFLRSYLIFKTGKNMVTNNDLLGSDDKLDWAEIGELYGEFIQYLDLEISKKLAYLSIDQEKGISSDDIETSDYGTASITGLPLQGFGGPVPFWRHRS